MEGYYGIESLTADQFDELRGHAEIDLTDVATPDEWWNEDGSLKDEIVRRVYADTVFSDDDFLCTANSAA